MNHPQLAVKASPETVSSLWQRVTLRAITERTVARNRPDLPLLSVVRERGVILRTDSEDNHNPIPDDLSNYRVVRCGDLVFNKMKAWQGSLGVSPYDGVVSPAYIVCRLSPTVSPRFVHYVLRSRPYSDVWRSLSYGVRVDQWDLRYEDIKQVSVLLPPRDEQDAIVRFLEEKERDIEHYLATKRRMIEVLEERRTAIITSLLAQGLRRAPLRRSELRWVPTTPVGWDTVRLKHVCRLETGHTPSVSEPGYWIESECIHPWVSLSDSKTLEANDHISNTEKKISDAGIRNSAAHLIEAGAVVVSRDARVGLASILAVPMAVSQHMIAWVCGPRVRNEFLLQVMYGMRSEFRRLSSGSTIPTIGMPEIKQIKIPLPDINEQFEISLLLKRQTSLIKQSIMTLQAEIAAMEEYRTRLIADAVTGQIDVRRLG